MIYLDIIIVYPIYRHSDRSKDPGDLEELPVYLIRLGMYATIGTPANPNKVYLKNRNNCPMRSK